MRTYKSARRQKQSNTIKGEGNPNWKGGQITKLCIRCDSPFLVYPSTSNRTHCSLVCANRDIGDKKLGRLTSIHKDVKIEAVRTSGRGIKIVSACEKCGKTFRDYANYKRKYCSQSCAVSVRMFGDRNNKWKGGITPFNEQIRHSMPYKEWQIAVFERDNYTCRKCGKHGVYLNAHHIKPFADYPELRFKVDNGETLCLDCHNKTKVFWGNQYK